jgi:hypothetical protein
MSNQDEISSHPVCLLSGSLDSVFEFRDHTYKTSQLATDEFFLIINYA